jgi:hypothetical protein
MNNGGDQYGNQDMTDFDEQIDWEHVGNPPPPHEFNLECEQAEYKRSTTNRHMIKTKWKITGYDQKWDDEKYMGRTVFANLNFSQEGAFLTKQLFPLLGLDLPRTINAAILEDICGDITGKTVSALLKHRQWNGQTQADISKFGPMLDVGQAVGDDGVEDTTGSEEAATSSDEESLETDAAPDEEVAEEAEPTPPPVRRSLREAAAAAAPAKKTNGTNGHTNGHTQGLAGKPAAKPAAKAAPPPAKKTVSKPQPRR